MNIWLFDEWVRHQGCGYIVDDKRRCVVFENGAQWKIVPGQIRLPGQPGRKYFDPGDPVDPPDDPRQLVLLKLVYQRKKLKDAEAEFHEVEKYISMQSQFCAVNQGPPVNPAVFDDLKSKQQEVLKRRDIISKLEVELVRTMGAPVVSRRQAEAANRKAQAQDDLKKLRKIRI